MDAAESFIRSKYPFIDAFLAMTPDLYGNIYSYDAPSCGIISRLCHAGMVTVDTMQTQTDCQAASVLILLANMWNVFWGGYVAFSQAAVQASGTQSISLTSAAGALLDKFSSWDEALQPNPFPNIGAAFYSLLSGVTP